MGFIARVLGTFAGQAAGSPSTLPAPSQPRRAVSTPALARSPVRAGSLFARFSVQGEQNELPVFRDRRGQEPSAQVRQLTVERLAPRLAEVANSTDQLRAQLGDIQAQLEPQLGASRSEAARTALSSAPLQTPVNATQARQLDQQLERLGRFGQALGELSAMRRQLDAGLSGSGTTAL